ncbi:biotin synthase BioB [Planctomycetota bacterium]
MDTSTEYNAETLLKMPLEQLISMANHTRNRHIGDKLELCSIINAKSGLCGEDCKFCAQSAKHGCNVPVYPLKDAKEIVKAAIQAQNIGAKRFGIVTSGNKLTDKDVKTIAKAITQIKKHTSLIVCGSLGALEPQQLKLLAQAGLARYHHNIETSRRFYPQIVSTHSFDDRITTIKAAKQFGLELCSGGIIGMGETWLDRIDMAITLKELNVDSVPINILVPIEGTAIKVDKPISPEDVIKTLAIFRIILKDKTIKIAAGRESVLKETQLKAFLAGANGMIIGGYLTVKGNELKSDYKLIDNIKEQWKR